MTRGFHDHGVAAKFEILGHAHRRDAVALHYEQIQLRGFEGMRHALGKFGDVSAAVPVAS